MKKRQLGKSRLEVSTFSLGTTKLLRLEENLGAADIRLTDYDVNAINQALSKIEVQGNRYSEQAQKMVNQ